MADDLNDTDEKPLSIEQSAMEIIQSINVTTSERIQVAMDFFREVREIVERAEQHNKNVEIEVKRIADGIEERNRIIRDLDRREGFDNSRLIKMAASLWIWFKKVLSYASAQAKDIRISEDESDV